jgi:hypothetical protein
VSEVAENHQLEILSREAHVPLDAVVTLYRHEHDELAREARITNYISLLAARRVRHLLRQQVLSVA